MGIANPNEVAVYPDTGKVLVRALGRRALLDGAALRNYWDGEDTGLPPGRQPPADVRHEGERDAVDQREEVASLDPIGPHQPAGGELHATQLEPVAVGRRRIERPVHQVGRPRFPCRGRDNVARVGRAAELPGELEHACVADDAITGSPRKVHRQHVGQWRTKGGRSPSAVVRDLANGDHARWRSWRGTWPTREYHDGERDHGQ